MKNIKYRYCLLLLFILAQWQSYGSSFDSLALVERQEVEESLVLLKNTEDLLPLRRLDSLKIGSVFLGLTETKKLFQTRIDSYKESYSIEANAVFNIQPQWNNLLIVGIDSTGATYKNQMELLISGLKRLKKSTKVVLIVQSINPIVNQLELFDLASSVIYAPKHNDLSFDLAVQSVFGGIGLTGKLKNEDSNIEFQENYGLTTDKFNRMKYSIPEEVGVSSYLLDSGVTHIVKEAIDSMAFPGCQILMAKNGIVFYQKSFGYHTYDMVHKVENTDIYDMASISKVSGATTALMKLYDEGLFNLDVKFSTYWPDFEHGNKKDLLVREVLAHNARLKPYITYYLASRKNNGKYRWNSIKQDSSKRFPTRIASSSYFLHKDYKEKKIYKMIRNSKLNEEPGYVYSGLSFYLYPEIVYNLTGEKYDDYLYNHFFNELGATTLCFNPANKFNKERIIPTETDDFFRMEQVHGTVHDEGASMMQGVSGNAGLFSSANDLAKLWQMYLNGGNYGGKQYISNATIDEFTRCQFCDEDNRRGLGFDKPLIEYDSLKSSVARVASPASYGHSGYTGAIVWADPENQLLYIFLSNRVYPTRNNRKLYEMNIRPRIHNLIYDLLE
ncbi:serine hydrolase [Reichenbachiella sp. MALMAid0571]|uniref:serine hydrolase domain-containing protein n=1 Tax=Reichenbachiella sp. MALMAid0571 TaxID=3143939 RepID=UPI0032DF1CBE